MSVRSSDNMAAQMTGKRHEPFERKARTDEDISNIFPMVTVI